MNLRLANLRKQSNLRVSMKLRIPVNKEKLEEIIIIEEVKDRKKVSEKNIIFTNVYNDVSNDKNRYYI